MHGVGGAGGGFGVELAGEVGEGAVADAFDGVVVDVAEPDLPVGGEGGFVDGEAVVLAGDVAFLGLGVDDGLVLGAVAVGEFVGGGAGGVGEHLNAEADAEDGFLEGEGFLEDLVEGFEEGGVSGAVGNEDAVKSYPGANKVVVPGYADDGEVAGEEGAEDVVFHAAVDGDDGFGAVAVGGDFFW